MIGVVIPAHDEEALLAATLDAVLVATRHADLANEAVRVAVVLDNCTDGSVDIARQFAHHHPVEIIELDARNVGVARAAGAELVLRAGARWIAFTDADTLVSPNWLSEQLKLEADVVCGSVSVADWTPHGLRAEFIREHFSRTYVDADGHRHIHGANLGVSAAAYVRAGGFSALACSEDVALVKALENSGARIAWSAAPRVITSARTTARARGGFGDTLLAIALGGMPDPA